MHETYIVDLLCSFFEGFQNFRNIAGFVSIGLYLKVLCVYYPFHFWSEQLNVGRSTVNKDFLLYVVDVDSPFYAR